LENRILSAEYYLHEDVVWLARDLLGKVLVTEMDGSISAGVITETEAYSYRERGCHAYGKKQTARNKVMFSAGGVAYVYLCYGMHHLFNIVTNREAVPEAVLIRGIHPIEGIQQMMVRRKIIKLDRQTFSGPGKLTQALGITLEHNAGSLLTGNVWVEDRNIHFQKELIRATPRIGIDYAEEDALLPWRFVIDVDKETIVKTIGMNIGL